MSRILLFLRQCLTLCLTLGLALGIPVGLLAQTQHTANTPASDGPGMYRSYCATCHGLDGKGLGPAAKALKVPAADLTKLAKYNGGEFPLFHVMHVLSQPSGAHGSADMPVWTDVFRRSGQDDLVVQVRVYNLTKHVESLQDPAPVAKQREPKPAAPASVTSISPAAGGAMFRSYCASCHGADARGNGPAAWTLKTTPPDLTLVSRQNNGKYPEDRVRSVLTQGTADSIHGSSEMPVWGRVFRDSGEGENMRQMRVYNLVRYLESLQRQ